MNYILLFVVTVTIFSCENSSFDRDKRQLTAKSEIREKLHKVQEFDIKSFAEDTLKNPPDPAFKNIIRYSLNVIYKDSTGTLQNKKAFVLFTPDGKSVISSQIIN